MKVSAENRPESQIEAASTAGAGISPFTQLSAVSEFEVKSYREFIAKYGVLNSDHPISKFVEQRIKTLHPGVPEDEIPRVVVLASKGAGINAMAFSNGVMAITPEFIEYFKYIEELDSVLLHESTHIRSQHLKKLEQSDGSAVIVGQLRLYEYESDTTAFIDQADPRADSSPRGSLSLFERLREDHRVNRSSWGKENWDVIHGRITERISVLRAVLHQLELGADGNPLNDQIQRDLRVFPSELIELASSLPKSKLSILNNPTSINDSHFGDWQKLLAKEISAAKTSSQRELLVRFFQNIDLKLLGVDGSHALSREARALPSRVRFHQAIDGERRFALDKWFASVDKRAVACGARHDRDILLARYWDTLERFDLDLLSAKSEQDAFAQAMRSAAFGSSSSKLVFTKEDLPFLLNFISKSEPTRPASVGDNLAFLTRRFMEHGVFDRTKGDGVAPKRLCNWLKTCAESITDPSEVTIDSVRGEMTLPVSRFVPDSLIHALRLNEDLNGESPEQIQGWVDAIKDLSNSSPSAALGISLILGNGRFNPSKFAVQVLAQATDSDRTIEQLQLLDRKLSNFISRAVELSVVELTEAAQELVSLVGSLPINCFVQSEDNLGIFSSIIQVVAESASRFSPDRAECALLLVDKLLKCELPEEKVPVLADMIVSILQVSVTSQGHYDYVINSCFNPAYALYRDVSRPLLFHIVPRLGEISSFIPEDKRGAASKLVEPHWIRDETSVEAITLLEELCKTGTDQEFLRAMGEYLEIWSVPRGKTVLTEIFNRGLDTLKGPPSTLAERIQLYDVAHFAPDVQQARSIHSKLLPEILSELDVAGKIGFLLDRYPKQARYGVTNETLNAIDRSLRTPQDFRLIEDRICDVWRSGTALSSKASSFVLGDTLSQVVQKLDKAEWLEAILETGESDQKIRELLLQAWYLVHPSSVAEVTRVSLEEDNEAALAAAEDSFLNNCRNLSERRFLSDYESSRLSYAMMPESWITRLYSLGPVARMALLRDALIGPGGILEQKDGKTRLVDVVSARVLGGEIETERGRELKRILKTFVASASNDELCELLVGALSDKVLCPPRENLGWNEALDSLLAGSPELWVDAEPGSMFSRATGISNSISRKDYIRVTGYLKPILNRLIGSSNVQDPELSSKLESLGVGLDEPREEDPSLDALSFITNVGSQLDAPGVRTLQLVGQLISNLDGEVRERLLKLYDARNGQSALAAWRTLGKIAPGFRDSLSTFGPQLGGGSIYTVFEGQVSGVGKEAIRVMNPNALSHVGARHALLQRTLDQLVDQDPKYESVRPIIDLVDNWIRSEMQDRDFQTLDPQFRAQWNGWAPEWAQQKGISVKVPEFRAVNVDGDGVVLKVVRDELVEGVVNFTRAEELSSDTLRDMTALNAQFYLAQIIGANPIADSFVLSDISKGNAGIKADDSKLVIFDRGMYLRFSFSEKLLMNGVISAEGKEQLIEAAVRLLSSFPENREISGEKIKALLSEFMDKNQSDPDQESLVFRGISELFCQGVHLPLKWSLLFKNINAHRQMACDAGFRSLAEALQHRV